MFVLKIFLSAVLLLSSLALGLLFGLVGLWSGLAFALFSVGATVYWRLRHGAGRYRVYFVSFGAALALEVMLLLLFTKYGWLGMHSIMDGYTAPGTTQALIAFSPVATYVASLHRWASSR